MASFVESATLLVKDQSTAKINKINAALKKLFATAKSLKSTNIKINVNMGNVRGATTAVRALKNELRGLRGQSVNLRVNTGNVKAATAAVRQLGTATRQLRSTTAKVNVNTSGISQARRQLTSLRAAARAPININTNARGATPHGTGTNAAVTGRRAARGRTAGAAVVQGAATGFGMTSAISGLVGEFGGLQAAAYAAAAALRKVGELGLERSRTNLQTQAMASPAQQAVYDEIEKTRPTYKDAPLPFPKDAFHQLRNEIAGDVAGDTPEQTARNADAMTRMLQNEMYPGLMARNPTWNAEQGREGMKKIVKAANIGTTEIFNDKGEVSSDYKRFAAGVETALKVNPELKPEAVRTTFANLKTSGFTLDSDAIAQTLVQAGDLGPRVGNETFRLQRSLQGIVDNKKLNNALADRGIIVNPQRSEKGNKNVLPGTGTIPDQDTILSNPSKAVLKEFMPDINRHLAQNATQERITKKMAEGQSREQAEQTERVGVLGRVLPSLPQTALNQLNQLILGAEAWQRQKSQAGIAPDAGQTGAMVAENPAIMWEGLKTAAADAAGSLGELALSSKGVKDGMAGITNLLRGEPLTPDQKGAVTAGAVGAVGLTGAVVAAFAAPVVAMNASAAAQLAAAQAMAANTAASATTAAGAGAAGVAAGTGIGAAATVAAVAAPVALAAIGGLTSVDENEVLSRTSRREKGENIPTPEQKYGEEMVKEATAAFKPWYQIGANEVDKERYVQKHLAEKEKQEANIRRILNQPEPPVPVEPAKPSATQTAIDKAQTAIDHANKVAADAAKQPPVAPPVTQPIPVKITDAAPSNVPTVAAPPLAPVGPTPNLDAATQVSTSLNTAVSSLVTTSSTFSTVFTTGATAISTAGTTAASALTGAAPGIGSAIGNAAATAIKAAVGNLNINVNANVSGGGADTGSQKAATK